jgi:signal transduction histidine kinase
VASIVTLFVFGLFGLGVLLSNTYGATEVAAHARRLHSANATLGASGIARAAVAQAVFFSYDEVSDRDGDLRAIEEARANLNAVLAVGDSPDVSEDDDISAIIDEFVTAANDAVDLAEEGDSSAAEAVRLASAEPAYAALRDVLTARQTELAGLIADSEQTGGRISRITFVAISFVIPALTMIGFWVLLRRRVRVRETEMQDRLEAERALNLAKDELIAGLSHELRTPLTSIVGFSQLLIENESLSPDAREQLAYIHGSSADLTRMVEDLLTAARLDAGALTFNFGSVNLKDEIDAATSSYALSGEDLDIWVSDDLEVYGDGLHVRQILNNLVSNALRHGGDRILVSATRRGPTIVLVVADDGPGVPAEIEERLFQRFVHEGRQALVAGSIGLGLAISRELASRMDGALRYVRTEDWSTFSLVLPALPVGVDHELTEELVRSPS